MVDSVPSGIVVAVSPPQGSIRNSNKVAQSANNTSFLSQGQPFGEYNGNRVATVEPGQQLNVKTAHSASLLSEGQPFGEYKGNRVGEQIGIGLCNCIGCALLALNNIWSSITRFLAVECDETKKTICDNLNDGNRGGIIADHTWASNAYDITYQKIKGLGGGSVKTPSAGPPYKDHSKLRDIPRNSDNSTQRYPPSARPGFNGKHGTVFLQVLLIMMWVLNLNPACEVFVECTDFRDMPGDWARVCSVLGGAIVVNADICSNTRRRRAYWVINMELPDGFGTEWTPLNPDDCMDTGRSIIKYLAWGKECVYPLGASWHGSPDSPVADTERPILVRDIAHKLPQQLRVHDAELLMGHVKGSTAGNGVSVKQRLQGLGDGWDMNVVMRFFIHSSLSRINTVPIQEIIDGYSELPTLLCLSTKDSLMQLSLVRLLNDGGQDALCCSLMQYPREIQVHVLALVKHWSNNHPEDCLVFSL